MVTKKQAAAKRQARYRKHTKGDHSICIVGNCAAITKPPPPPEPSPEDEFGLAGQRLWRGTLEYGALTDLQRVMLREMARMADRLELLNSIIADENPDTLRWAMREARQTAISAKNLASELRQSGVAGGSGGGSTGKPAAEDHPETDTHGRGPGIGDVARRASLYLAAPAG